MYLYIKTFHIIFVVTWFAGLFYIVRLFIYNREAEDKPQLEKDILQKIYTNSGATTEDYPRGVYVYWRNGFYIAINYSSDNYKINISDKANILIGEVNLKPAGVLVWKE